MSSVPKRNQANNREVCRGGMKLFCFVALAIQVVLISSACYFEHLADVAMLQALKEISSGLFDAFHRSQHYSHLEDVLDYTEAFVWILVVVIVNLKKVASTGAAYLSVYMPFLVSFLLSFI